MLRVGPTFREPIFYDVPIYDVHLLVDSNIYIDIDYDQEDSEEGYLSLDVDEGETRDQEFLFPIF